MLQARNLSLRNPLNRWENGQCRHLSVCLRVEKFHQFFIFFCLAAILAASVKEQVCLQGDYYVCGQDEYHKIICHQCICLCRSDPCLHLYAKLIICAWVAKRKKELKFAIQILQLLAVGVWQVVRLLSTVEEKFNNICVCACPPATVDVFCLHFWHIVASLENHGMFVRHCTMNARCVKEHLGPR